MRLIPEEWLSEPDDNGDGLLRVTAAEGEFLSFPVETHAVSMDEVTLGAGQEFSMIFEAAGNVKVYADEDACMAERTGGMAPESFISSGMFPAGAGEDFRMTGTSMISGKVVRTYGDPCDYGFEESDVLVTVECLGHRLDVVIHDDCLDAAITLTEGSIVSGVFWIQGWPEQDM